MLRKRIVITGIGIISNLGFSQDEYWENRKNNNHHLSEENEDNNFNHYPGYKITSFNAKQFIKRRYIKPLDRVTRFCISGIGLAIKDSKLDIDSHKIGIIAGSMYHGIESIFTMKETYKEGGVDGVSPLFFPGTVFNASGAQAAIEWNITGPNCVVNNGMVSGLTAINKGIEYLLLGRVNAAIVGGHEMFHEFIYTKYEKLGYFSNGHSLNGGSRCMPFDSHGKGLVLGEGSCYFVLETYENAQKRKADIYGEIVSYHYVFSDKKTKQKDDFVHCINECLTGNRDNKIDLIICDGWGDKTYDKIQADAISEVIGKDDTYVISNKGCIGHTLGVSGAFNTLEGLLSLKNNGIAPVHHLTHTKFKLNFPREYIEKDLQTVLITSYDPQGNMAAMLIK